MLNLENKSKFQRDILQNNISIYPIALIDDEIFISTVKESIINNPDENNPIYLKDYGLKISNIKESINLKSHKFSISNVTLTFNNYLIDGERFSDVLSEKSNKKVLLYFKTQSCKYLSDCLLVYRGIIKRYSHDDNKISLTLEDITDNIIHQDLPRANMGYGSHCLSKKDINKYIPMTYGRVKKAPLIPYLSLSENADSSTLTLIPDDVGDVTQSDRNIVIEGFFSETANSENFDFLNVGNSSPLMLYKDDYYRVLMQYNSSVDRLTGNDSGYPESVQFTIDDTSNFIKMNKEYLAGYAQNSTAVSELQTVKVVHPTQVELLSTGEQVIGANDSSIINISPLKGILKPEASIDNIDSPSLFQDTEFQSYSSVPNTHPNMSEAIESFMFDEAYLIDVLETYDQLDNRGVIYPNSEVSGFTYMGNV